MGALKSLDAFFKFTQLPLLSKNQGQLLSLIQSAKSPDFVVCGFPLLHL
jgi:hypothetical protein